MFSAVPDGVAVLEVVTGGGVAWADEMDDDIDE
jgi:hypothetical protein